MRKTVLCFSLVFLVLLFFASCGFRQSRPQDQPVGPPAVKKKVPADNRALAQTQATNRILKKRREINRRLGKGDFFAALAVIRQAIQQGTSEKKLAAEYLRALNGAIRQGQSQLTANNPGKAGLLFAAALDSFPKDAGLVAGAGLTSAELKSNIELCADKLMEKGLIAYRAGDLENAIAVWEKTLTIFPQHRASQKALQTANVQLTNLKRITADK